MGDQPMEALDDFDWSADSHMECDVGASWDMVTEESTRRYEDFTHPAFVKKLRLQILPNDQEHSEGFDIPTTFRIGPQRALPCAYDTSGAMGKPEWDSLFGFIGQNESSAVSVDCVCSCRQP